MTYAELIHVIDTVALNLQKLGFRQRDTLVLYYHNQWEYIVITLAVLKLGGRVAPINKLMVKGNMIVNR